MASIDEELKSNFQRPQQRLVANLMFTAGWMRNRFTDFIKPFGISMPQFNILRILRGAGDWVSMSDIKNLMVEKSPNATRLADKLVDKKLVERQRSESDRRVVYLRLSEAGAELLERIDEVDHGQFISFMDVVTDEEARTFSDVLDRIRG